MTDSSQLGALKAALSAAVATKSIALRIPKSDPGVYVRYRAFERKELERIRDRFLKKNATDRELAMERAAVKANPALLAQTCEGIFLLDESGELVSADPDGDNLTFGPRLAELLGKPEQEDGSAYVRMLYADNDFDIAAAVEKLSEFSGGARAEVYEESAGN